MSNWTLFMLLVISVGAPFLVRWVDIFIDRLHNKLKNYNMKKDIKIEVNGVKITLTPEQLKEIAKQTDKRPKLEDIESYEDACDVLEEEPVKGATAYDKLKMIIKAANYIVNGYKHWKKDWSANTSQRKWFPYFQRTSSGWSFYSSSYCDSFSYSEVGYCIDEATSNHIGRKFLKLYVEVIEED